MPIAILKSASGTGLIILSGGTDGELQKSLWAVDGAPPGATVPDLSLWLLAQPYPSGWYNSAAEACARMRQDQAAVEMDGEELAAIRALLGQSRASFAANLGFAGTANTRHKQVWEMERARKPILTERARSARALEVIQRLTTPDP